MRTSLLPPKLYYLIILLMGVWMIGLTSASLGSFQQNDCVPIVTNLNASTVNISILTNPSPNPSIVLQNVEMTKNGNSFNYTFCDTSKRGIYTYGYTDQDGNNYSNSFSIGDPGWVLLVLGVVMILTFALGFFSHNVWFVYVSGILAFVFGVYDISNGFAYMNDVFTQSVGFVAVGFGIIFFTMAAYEQLSLGDDNWESED